MSRLLRAGAVVAVVLATLSGCSLLQMVQSREDRLNHLVEGIQPTIPQIMDDYPGVYERIEITGYLTTPGQVDGGPDGEVAVLQYAYYYARTMTTEEWATATDSLGDQADSFEETCENSGFSALRLAGVTGPLGVRFYFQNGPGAPADQYWEQWCWSDN